MPFRGGAGRHIEPLLPAAGADQTITLGLASETDSALPVLRSVSIGLATETDSALGVLPPNSVWLSGYGYRMDMPVANPAGTASRSIVVPFPGWFLKTHPSGAKILKSDYSDVHVTTAVGGELPCAVNVAGSQLTIDYASMPLGETTLYVFYGNASATAPTAATGGYSTSVQAVNPNGEISFADRSTTTDYVWGADVDATYISSGASGSYLGGSTTHSAGISSTGSMFHYLIRPGEWMLRKGVTSSAKLHLYMASNAVASGTASLRCHRLKNYGTDDSGGNWNRNAWSCDDTDSLPTWNTRIHSVPAGGDLAWATAGATNATEIDSTEYVSLSVASGAATGYQSLALTSSWIDDWQGDSYSNGLLIKDSTDSSSGSDRYVAFSPPSAANSPVFEVSYSSVNSDQLSQRKLTTDTYFASTFSVQNRYLITPSENSMAVMSCINAERKWDFFYISAEGRIRRVLKNQNHSSIQGSQTSPGWGMHWDSFTGRFWVVGTTGTGPGVQDLKLGYSPPYTIDSITWVDPGVSQAYKGTLVARNDVVYLIFPTFGGTRALDKVKYLTYNRGTSAFSSTTELANCSVSGESTLSASINASDTTISLANAGSYPSYGSIAIGTEFIWYTGKSGNDLTGCIRGMFNSTAATHTSGTIVRIDQSQPGYVSSSYDSANDVMRLTFVVNSMITQDYSADFSGGNFIGVGVAASYNKVVNLNYSFARSRWEDAAGASLSGSLPLTNTTWPVVSRSNYPAYGYNLLCMPDGTALQAFGEYANKTAPADVRVARLSGGSWTSAAVDSSIGQASLTRHPNGVRLSAVYGLGTVRWYDSSDGGASWGYERDIATHVHAQPTTFTYTVYGLSCSDVSEDYALNNRSLVYYQHFTSHGALYLTSVPSTTVTNTVDAILTVPTSAHTKTHTVDAVVKATATKTHTVDAFLRATATSVTHTVDAVLRSLATVDSDSLLLRGTELNDDAIFRLVELDLTPPKKREEWVEATDGNGAVPLRDSLWEQREVIAKIRVKQQVSKTAALARIGEVSDLLEVAQRDYRRTGEGTPLVFTAKGSSAPFTFSVLSGSITEIPLKNSDPDAGWHQDTPVFVIRMVCESEAKGPWVTSGSTTSSAPLVTHLVASVGGDAPADAELIVTDAASKTRRHFEWGLDLYDSTNDLQVDMGEMTIPSSSSSSTRSGSYNTNIIHTGLTTTPVVVATLPNLTHVGSYRTKLRLYCDPANSATPDDFKVRLSWREGDGPLRSNGWVSPPVVDNWAEIDLGTITVPQAVLGSQRWTGQIEAYTDGDTGDAIDIDYLIPMPTTYGYGKGRAPLAFDTPTAITARDEFDQAAGNLNGKTLPLGGTWATSGSTTDLAVEATGHTVERSTTGDASKRFAIAGSTVFTNCRVSIDFKRVEGLGTPYVIARWTDSTHYVAATITGDSLEVFTVGGSGTSFPLALLPDLDTDTFYTLTLAVGATGSVLGAVTQQGSSALLGVVRGSDTALATGGALESGKAGFGDYNSAITAATRNYDNFWAAAITESAVVYSGKSAEIHSDIALRADAAGTYYGQMPSHRPAPRFTLQPAGPDGLTNRVAAKLRRNDIDEMADDHVADSTTVSVRYRNSFISVPR